MRRLTMMCISCIIVSLMFAGQGYAQIDPNTVVGIWLFDEGGGDVAQDFSGNGNDGTLNGPAWTNESKFDSALEFNGAGSYIEFATGENMKTPHLTFMAWFNTRKLNGYGHIFQTGNDWDDMAGYVVRVHQDGYAQSALAFAPGNTATWLNGPALEADTWYHMALTYDGTTATLYLDGVNVASNPGQGEIMYDDQPVRIGVHSNDTGSPFDGFIDEVALFDVALGAEDIEMIMDVGLAGAIGGEPIVKARKPDPADGAVGVETPLLQWTGHKLAAFHEVYFGTNPTPGLDEFRGRQSGMQTVYYHAAGLVPGTTYYWRIDEVEADGTIHTGDVWSFFAPPLTAWNFSPADGAKDVFTEVTLSWSPGQGSVMYHLYFADDFDAVNDGTTEADKSIMTQTSYKPGILYPETVHYWRVDTFNGSTWDTGDILSFTTIPGGTGKIIREWWYNIGGGNAVSDLTGNPNYPDNPTGWEFVDIFEGPVDIADSYGSRLRGWLFPPATGDYIFWLASDNQGQLRLSTDEDPANAQLIASVPDWVPSRDFDNTGGGNGGPEQKSAPIALDEGRAYYIEALMKEGGGGDNIAVAWQGPIGARQIISAEYVGPTAYAPVRAYSPRPGDGATDVAETATLGWLAGANAAQHDVFFGTDRAAVAGADTTTAGIYRGRQALAATSYVPTESPLAWDTTYYWRIDEVNSGHPDALWKGNVWSFTTANFIMVEDFEEYDDFCNRIFYKWKDGWGHSADPDCGVAASAGNGTGSTVGNLAAPYAEQTIVHAGIQSMPYEYNNTGTGGKARYSEASREFVTPQNWARNDVKALTLWFRGEPGNTPETLYVAVEDSLGQVRVATHPNPEALQVAAWQQWNIALTQFSGVNLASVKKLYIGVGNRNNPQMGGTGKLYFDDIRVYPARCVPSLAKPAADLSDNCIVDYADVEIISDQWLDSGFVITPTDPGNSGLIAHYPFNGNANDVVGGHNGTTSGFVTYGAGKIDRAIILDGVDDMVTVGSVGISGAAARTISGWVRANATVDILVNWINIFGFSGPATNNYHFDMQIGEAQGRRGYVIHVHGWERVILDVDFEWHHLAASYDGTTIAWYGDGRLGGTDSSRALDTQDNVRMGKREDNDNYFPGRVDEVRIFNRVLSQAEIAWLAGYTSPLSIPADLYQDDVIDFKDLAVLGDAWLEEILWP